MKKFFLLCLLLPLFSYRPSTSGEDVFFGDSITFGNELGALQYTARWSSQYCNAISTVEINEAHSGASMAPNPYSRPVFNLADVPGYQSSFRHIFVSYWVNDFLYGTTPAAYAAATTAAVDGIIAKGWPAAKIVLCFNYLPESGTNWPYLTHATAQQWLAALRGVQQARGTSFLDFYTLIYNRADKDSYAPDGIHPTAAWNTIMKQYAQTNIEAPPAPLPVTFVSFSGQRQGATNLLKWTVGQELNVDRYEIEASDNGRVWTKAGEVAAAGTSVASRSYSFVDRYPRNAKQYYRLRAIDKSGAVKLSAVVVVNSAKTTGSLLNGVFPNPAKTAVTVQLEVPAKENLTVTLLDATGRTVRAQKVAVEAGSNTATLNIESLNAGVYTVRVLGTNGLAATQRFLKN